MMCKFYYLDLKLLEFYKNWAELWFKYVGRGDGID